MSSGFRKPRIRQATGLVRHYPSNHTGLAKGLKSQGLVSAQAWAVMLAAVTLSKGTSFMSIHKVAKLNSAPKSKISILVKR